MNAENKNNPSKKKRVLRTLAVLILLAVLLPLATSYYVMASTENRILTPEEAAKLDADAILVLGARVWDDGQPSAILKDRLQKGVDLYEAGASDRLLMSGDHGQDDYDEVNAMKDYVVGQGVPSEVVFMDHAGFSTYESLYRARDIFQIKTIVIVSQQYHLYRALYIAERLGLNAYGVSCDRRVYNPYLLFSVRETLARCKDFFYSIFQPLPTYLGDVIPITGDGSATNG
ncbi:MAG TPA: YdcF family protein [Clostridia bacterium]|nr:YdcF family protein [Clostridia bacterium]